MPTVTWRQSLRFCLFFAERFDEPVGDHELGGRDPGRVHPQAPQHLGEAEFFRRPESDDSEAERLAKSDMWELGTANDFSKIVTLIIN